MHNILLMEPGYKNKYPPLGLMKISAYHRSKGDHVHFAKGINNELLRYRWDRIYVTTLFSFEFKKIAEQIDFAITCANGQHNRVFVGGIAASLMTDEFLKEPRWFGVRFIQGLLDQAPAVSLQLDQFAGEFYSDDFDSLPIESQIPDYSILEHISDEYVYPVNDAYFGYASRGCVRKCHFCGVPKLEGAQRDSGSISHLIEGIAAQHGEKRHLILMDNNITASLRYEELIDEIRSLGFEKDAYIERDGRKLKRRVDFNQGVDARILVKDEMYLRKMSEICISPLRIAFDHLGLKKQYEKSVILANGFGIPQLSNYMLYNFHDSPQDLYERLRINIRLNQKLGIRIWSFPMRYQPVTLKNRSHVGRKWIWYWLRSFQIILQATHGVVSGNPGYFERAFGSSHDEFKMILMLPHRMIFHREFYETGEGSAERDEFQSIYSRLTDCQLAELIELLSHLKTSTSGQINALVERSCDPVVKRLLPYYEPLSTTSEQLKNQVELRKKQVSIGSAVDPALSEDQWVEDAGLYDDGEDQLIEIPAA